MNDFCWKDAITIDEYSDSAGDIVLVTDGISYAAFSAIKEKCLFFESKEDVNSWIEKHNLNLNKLI